MEGLDLISRVTLMQSDKQEILLDIRGIHIYSNVCLCVNTCISYMNNVLL